jgi:hypothetical protein
MDILILLRVGPGAGARRTKRYIRFVSASFASIADQCRSRFNDESAFDGVDYPPKVMFNQTKWNDSLHQKN